MVDDNTQNEAAADAAEAVVASAEAAPSTTSVRDMLNSALESLIAHAAGTLETTGVSAKDTEVILQALGDKKSELDQQLGESLAGNGFVASEAAIAPILESLAAEVAPMLAAEALNLATAAERTNVLRAGSLNPEVSAAIPAAEMTAVQSAAEMTAMQSAAEVMAMQLAAEMMAGRAAAEASPFAPAAAEMVASEVTPNMMAAEPMPFVAAEAMGMLAAEARRPVVFYD